MSDHSCDAVVVTCIDFRFQEYITNWIKENFPSQEHDRVALAGGVFGLETVLKQVEISNKLHHIRRVIFINHEDCGAYGEEGTYEKHVADLQNAASKVKEQFSKLEVETYYLRLDGTFEKTT